MENRLPRKLTAILYADVAGYSRLTGDDEDATHRALSKSLEFNIRQYSVPSRPDLIEIPRHLINLDRG